MGAALTGSWEFLRKLARRCRQDNISTWAAATSFYALISLFPLIALGLAGIAELFASTPATFDQAMRQLAEIAPGALDSARHALRDLIRDRRVLALAAVLLLLWSGSRAMLSLESACNAAWQLPNRSFLKGRLLSIGATLVLGLLFLLSVILTLALVWVRHRLVSLSQQPWLWDLAGIGVAIIVSFLAFFLLYRLLPNTSVSYRTAILVALFATAAWELAKHGLGLYLTYVARRQLLYGSLGGVVIVVLWIYCSALIALVGAELAAMMEPQRPLLPSVSSRRP